jgi:uncharacterized protein (TIGR03000 family)
MSRSLSFLAAGLVGVLAVLARPGPCQAQYRRIGPAYRPVYPANRMPGWDWRRTYPWSPYNYGRNPYNPIVYPYVYPYSYPYSYPGYLPEFYAYEQPPILYGAADSANQVLVPNPSGALRTPPPGAAVIRMYVPDMFTQVWFNGEKTTSVGTTRYYVTPELPEGKPYHYEITARWTRDGQPVTEERAVNVSPGRTVVVDFTRPGS